MVTGSHIPADRNGLKFYTPAGEITKADEAAILAALGRRPGNVSPPGRWLPETAGNAAFIHRYVGALGAGTLKGRRIGVYSHSAVGREVMFATLRGLGAEAVEFGRSETFIPVDTEAVVPEVARQIAAWVQENRLDALISTDGDSDRPLLADETGRILPGDILGQIAAQALGAETVVTPVSSNSGVMQKGFARVIRTKIGSPFVIAAMEAAGGRVVGYEANGGFLLGFDAALPGGVITALPTRDFMLPILMVQDVVSVWAFRKDFDRRNLGILLAGAMIGIVLSAIFVALSVQVGTRTTGEGDLMQPEKRLFAYSIAYLFILFGAVVADHWWPL